MLLKYQIFQRKQTEVCIPSDDYYRKGDDWNRKDIEEISLVNSEKFDSIEDCIKELQDDSKNSYSKGDYLFIPVFTKI